MNKAEIVKLFVRQ